MLKMHYLKRFFTRPSKKVVIHFTEKGLDVVNYGVKKEDLQNAAVTFFKHAYALK